MALADIQEKKAEDRKREKRLVHFTNSISRDFLNSKELKSTTKSYKNNADYVTKSFLDYIFFNENKEIREMNDTHLQRFMLEYAPRKLSFKTETANTIPEVLSAFLVFLETEGYVKNGVQLSSTAKANSRSFLKLITKEEKTPKGKQRSGKRVASKKAVTKKPVSEVKVGRNDPCPCGSGKKYKKCCGRLE